ncbi:sulfite exporter TauE/SafE family protein [Amycolatopsis orientalis]|uniref:sulfite exporter TauE/SafE family protein n=1 Tax=Amycolatopsis orientalis TaxID=31958 RepID=UPI0003A723EB|nr:sulfite exporter TauE/SafE family protein [Amycolatopsis orientalis]
MAQVIAALVVTGLLAGIGITAVGPGGVLATVGLFVFTSLSPAQVAGTAIVTHVATGILGSAAFVHSGQLREPETRRVAGVLAAAATVGTPLGVLLNSAVSTKAFGIVLGGFALVVAVFVGLKGRERPVGLPVAGAIGTGVAVVAGLVGVGGPMLAVPLLVVAGMPVLGALAAAQVQSVVIASVGTLGYVLHGAVDWPLAAIVGIPELAGVLIGWRIAHALPAKTLKAALVAVLVGIAPYLALHG